MKNTMRRGAAGILAVILLATVLCLPAGAAVQSNTYILSATATISKGTTTGQLKIAYGILTNQYMDVIGIKKIEVYRSNMSLYRTITGTYANGLLTSSASTKSGNYSFTVPTGYSYYCKVTFTATKGGNEDTTTVNTALISPPA